MNDLLKLRRFLEVRPKEPARNREVCELCGAALGETHGHVIDVRDRRLMCSCRPCYLLFTQSGAAGGKFRSVPERYVKIPQAAVDEAWDALQIPVGMAFFLRNSQQSKIVALYPGPAGATEADLPLETFDALARSSPALETLEPDVEALLICRRRDRSESWILPVDACYELVGRIRRRWKGFEGGEEAWREIGAFFDGLAERATESWV